MRTAVALLAVLLAAPVQAYSLFAQDDAASGQDAGDDVAHAMPVPPLHRTWRDATQGYEGNLTLPVDAADVYALDLQQGDYLRIDVYSFFPPLPVQTCVLPVLLMPDGTPYGQSEGCENGAGWPYPSAHLFDTIIPVTGRWYVQLTSAPPYSGLTRQPYILVPWLVDRPGHGAAVRFDNVSWAAARVAVGAADEASYAEFHVHVPGPLANVFRSIVLADSWRSMWPRPQDYDQGAIVDSVDHAVALHAAGVDEHVALPDATTVPLGAVFNTETGSLVVLERGYTPMEPMLDVLYADVPLSGWFVLGYRGDESATVRTGPAIVEARLSDFPQGTYVETPAGGLALDAHLPFAMPRGFLGAFRLSLPQGLLDGTPLDASEGGYTDAAGRSVELHAEQHPSRMEPLLLPAPGAWDFWVRKDLGLHDEQVLLDGIQVPDEVLQR
jgi:hypothetical protein